MFLSYLWSMKLKKKYKWVTLLIIVVACSLVVLFRRADNGQYEPQISLYLNEQDEVIKIQLEEYIIGTVAAEMPASFEMEALKAQAVCARTYAVKKIINRETYPQGADLSDDISTCQAFIPRQDFASSNPDRNDLLKKVEAAVESTRGEIMIYDSQPIDALYCSTCGGRTENASAVWGGEIDYLKSVVCSDCKGAPHYREEIECSNESLARLVGDKGTKLKIGILSKTPSGRPQKIDINGKTILAKNLREKLKLPSAWIDFRTSANTTLIISRGYGHGVGLCQYGANGMAMRGKDYHQILQKYYQGINFYKLGY